MDVAIELILRGIFGCINRNPNADERRSCFWFIICLAVLCLLVGGILWFVFG